MLSSLSPARRRLVLGTLGLVVLVVVALAGTAAVRAVQGRGHEVTRSPRTPSRRSCSCRGTAARRATSSRSRLRSGRRAARRRSCSSPATAPATSTIRPTACRTPCRQAVDGGADSVDLVGYSAGGVTVRALGARRTTGARSPAGSSPWARRSTAPTWPRSPRDLAPGSCPEACRQLATDSDLMRSLNSGDETPDGPRWVSIWTTDDQVSVPPRDRGRSTVRWTSPCSRSARAARSPTASCPTDPAVIAMVLAELQRTPPVVRPGRSAPPATSVGDVLGHEVGPGRAAGTPRRSPPAGAPRARRRATGSGLGRGRRTTSQ